MYKESIILGICLPLLLCYKSETGKTNEASNYFEQGEKGENGYFGQHQNVQGFRQNHDKQNHQKQYTKNAGHKNGYNHNDGYGSSHHQAEKGRNGYHFVDNGRYAKGHSTKGHHNIHKLNEFKKNTDFYDEMNDEGFEEKHGGYEEEKQIAKGNKHKGNFAQKGFVEGQFGVLGYSDKGANLFKERGYDKNQGQDAHYANNENFAKTGGENGFKTWGFANFNKN